MKDKKESEKKANPRNRLSICHQIQICRVVEEETLSKSRCHVVWGSIQMGLRGGGTGGVEEKEPNGLRLGRLIGGSAAAASLTVKDRTYFVHGGRSEVSEDL